MCDAMTCIGCTKKAKELQEKKEELRSMIVRLDDFMKHYEFMELKSKILDLLDKIG